MNFNNYYLWPKKFLEDVMKERSDNLKPFGASTLLLNENLVQVEGAVTTEWIPNVP